MATYVPGSEQYLPDIKPFTPDYKFLSAVLDVRQDKYNTNWQATNDVYNKVVFADMSRQDTNSQREQYVNNLAPALEKISGMDLSLAQNVQSAKSVFAPFFEDKLIVKDIVKTANYRKEMSHAERLLASPDKTVNRQYWRDGKAALQYRMEDFINMDADAALNAPLYKYVPAPNLFEIAGDILSEQKPPLSIKYDVLSPNGEWIITKKNGEAIVGPALQILRNQLATDGRIMQAYQTKAYVAGRDFAAAGMEAGDFNSVEEGQSAWAQTTISNIEFNNEQRLKEGSNAIVEQREVNVRWDNYKKQYGIVPGSIEEKIMNDQLTAYEKTKLELENQIDIKKVINTPSNNLETTLNRAYQLVLMTNLNSDMIKAAESFSMRDMESTIKENPYEIQKRKFQNEKDLLQMRFDNDAEVAAAKAEAAAATAEATGASALINALGQGGINLGQTQTNSFMVNPITGEIDSNSDAVLTSYKEWYEDQTKITGDQISAIIESLQLRKPKGEVVDGIYTNKYTIAVEKGSFTGTIKELEYMMQNKNSNGSFTYKKEIEELYKQQSNSIFELEKDEDGNDTKTYKIFATIPGLNMSTDFQNLGNTMLELNKNMVTTDMNFKSTIELYKTNYDVSEVRVKAENEDVKGMMELGMPGLYKEGSTIPMTQNEYIQAVIQGVKKGTIINYNMSGIDGTNHPNYMDWVPPTGAPRKDPEDEDFVEAFGTEDVWGIDLNEITKEAKIAYNALYEGLNNQIITGGNGGTYNSIKYGRTGEFKDAAIGFTIGGYFNAENPTGNGYNEVVNLVNQKNALNLNGIKPTVYFGPTMSDDSGESTSLILNFMDMFLQDTENHISNKDASGVPPSININYGSTLGPVDGEGTKTTAGYIIKPSLEYLRSKYITSGMSDPQKLNAEKNIRLLSEGFSMVYDKNLDTNPNTEKDYYGHPIIANIMNAENGIYTIPVNKGTTKVGEYSFQKGINNTYIVNTTMNSFDYNTGKWSETITSNKYDIINNNFEELDNAAELANNMLNFFGDQSIESYEKYTKINGSK
tara:strand:- start:3236 stop:6349 length:3114 start_codon:yes stop_codon:yes gene_type:complete